MRLLVTRAEPDAQATAARFRSAGHEVVVGPVLQIEPLAFSFDPAGVQALMFTSAAGVRAFGVQALPALVVGEATGEAARAAGYDEVRVATGDSRALVQLAAVLDRGAGALVHVSGENVAVDIAARLRQSGFDARRLVAYRAAAAARLPPDALDMLIAPRMHDGVVFHSRRGAETFLALTRAAGLGAALGELCAFCLSDQVAGALSAADFKAIRVASAPREMALLTLAAAGAGERA